MGTAFILLHRAASPAKLSRFFDSLARDDDARTDIVATPAQPAGFGPLLEGHAHPAVGPPPGKAQGLPIHLFVAHP